MPSLSHELRVFWFLQVVVTLLTAIHVSEVLAEKLLHGSRLGTFPKPDFRANFTLRSNQDSGSFKEIRHGLNVDPFYVRVYAKPRQGHNSEFCFDGIGSSQSSPSRSSYGGLIFAYNSEVVRIWAPTNLKGHVVFVKDGWGGEVNTQVSDEAEVVVELWRDGPAPTFQIEHLIDTRKKVYHLVDHELRQLPERVLVRLSPSESHDNSGSNPNEGFWFHAVAASQNPHSTSNFGGVIFAYNERYVRFWAPDGINNNTGCVFMGQEWGGGVNTQKATKCRVETRLWVNQLPTPTFQQDWFDFKGQRDQNSFKEIFHGANRLPALVLVQLKAINGRNIGYVFEAQGAAQSDDDGINEYGGVVFAYDENRVRIWAPSRHDESKKGYPLLVKSGWGNGSNLQEGHDGVQVRVVIYSSKCNGSSEILYEGGRCINTLHDSYKRVVSQWSECSSICNNGTKSRLFTGCDVVLKKTVLSCNFEAGSMCGWSNQHRASVRWVITNTSTPKSNTGPLWGHPKGSYYAYTDTTSATPNQEAILTSPNIGGVDKCHLHFFWSMYGGDVGTLKVFVNTKNPQRGPHGRWLDSKWNMTGPHGDIFWRAAFVNLEQFSKVYQVRFVHILPESDCDQQQCTVCKNQRCPAANVAIAGIRMDCQNISKNVPYEVCKKRAAPLSGCEIRADMPLVIGPAYTIQTVQTESYTMSYVRANGSFNDLIAIYEFEVAFTAEYVLWKQMFATSNETNDISFRIDEGEWISWVPPHKSSHALWTQYYLQTFKLKPGIHMISLRQAELGFRFLKLAVVPTKISMWSDLGMQSQYIPDGFLSAFPDSSSPEPKFGRLHAREAWCSSDHNREYVYFEIRLPQLALVSAISIQGGKDILQKSNDYWIKSFRMKVSLDGKKYTWYRDTMGRKGRRTFQANSDASSIQNHTLLFAAPARGIRIYPMEWANWICLRVELYGFYFSSEMCASSGPAQATNKPCVGDRNCGQNAECVKAPQISRIQKRDHAINITGESCHCYQAYHGPSCEHFGCSSNPCLNGGRCSETNNTFLCTCQPGYHGYRCEHPCKSGYYGYNCTRQCQCTGHGTCNVATGDCNCRRGYHGAYCEQVCSPGYFGYNCAQRCQCKNGASCDPVMGLCNCTAGWTGELCDRPCSWNMWGVNCSQNCSCWKSAKFCNRFMGTCVCLPGYHGEKCQHPCTSGTYGPNCSLQCKCQNNATCSRMDGTCNCTQPGWAGALCHLPCSGGYYGVNCAKECKCQNGAACDRETGSCTCGSGFSGQWCEKPCQQGLWGRNCSIACSCVNGAQCNSVSGQCVCQVADGCQCLPGWTGDDCSVPCNDRSWGRNCQNRCLCHNGVCNRADGSCLCLPGYIGANCDLACPQGYYGQNCAYKCRCASSFSTGCHPVNGTCRCTPGFVGQHCDIPCPTGRWGLDCSQSCACINGSCDPVSGNCTCNRGWQGLLCNQSCPGCGQPCPRCYHGNGSCDQVSGKCLCSPGYQGSSCLETCSQGHYGDKCQLKCDCAIGGTCHHVTGKCLCKPGWTGTRCDKVCRQGLFGHNCTQTCSCVRGTCDSKDGSCACPPGYHGYLCDRPCPSGQYGAGCSRRCQCGSGVTCDHITGQCNCPAGWTGKTCQLSCRNVSDAVAVVVAVVPGAFGANCSQICICPGSCDSVNGTCSCSRGFQGPNCLEACPTGLYGDNCAQKCNCKNNAFCDHVNGSCTCAPGWSGVNCTESCRAGYYGMLCASKCHCSTNGTESAVSCNSVTGECNCRPGYHGYKCEEQCREGFFGKKCVHRCICQNSYTCSITDGSCTCKPGYHGVACQLTCPADRYGVNCNNTCQCVWSNSRSCDRIDGTCTCKDGYTGVFCESVCPDGSYGRDCTGTCTCRNGAVCDRVKGTCACTAGFKGQSCETACGKGWFGVNCARKCICRNGANCSRLNGECDCAPGFTGTYCEYECASGRFGENCDNICDCNLGNSPKCDPRTGACICWPGFKGPRCDKPCEDGFYGEGCRKPCPVCSSHVIGPCEKAHGNCSCSPGYQGYLCFDDCDLRHYGLRCKEPCQCAADQLCHHINGMCLDISRGKFSLIVNDTMVELHDRVRKRDIKRGLEKLMNLYFDASPSSKAPVAAASHSDDGSPTQARLDTLDGNNGSSVKTDNPPGRSSTPADENKNMESAPTKTKHVFMVRLLMDDMQPVVKEDKGEATRVVCVLLDNFTVVDGHYVDEVLSRVPSWMISEELQVDYYTGMLYKKSTGSKMEMHLPLIIGLSVGVFLILVIIALFALIRQRYKRKCGFAAYKKGSTKDQAEFELQPWIGRNTGYLLAFDNPYYDVLAAMGLDDDIEEDYYNPLYDDVSMYSDSGENTSEDSCHKDLSSMVIRS